MHGASSDSGPMAVLRRSYRGRMRLQTVRASFAVRAFGRSLAVALLLGLAACGSSDPTHDPSRDSATTEQDPTEQDPTDPAPEGPAEGEPDEDGSVALSGLAAAVVPGSRVTLDWTVIGAEAIEIACIAPEEVRPLAVLPGDASMATQPIPAGDCLVLRVTANGSPDPVSIDVALAHVVTNGDDSGPGSLRAVLEAAPSGAMVGFAADVDEIVLVTVDTSAAHAAHLVFGSDVTVSGRPAAPVVLRSDDTLADDASGAPVLRSRIGYVPVGASVHLDSLRVTGGGFVPHGGGVRNDGDLTLSRSIVDGNRAWYWGGGVVNFGTAHLEDTEVRENGALVTNAERAAPYLCTGDPDRTCVPGDANYVAQLGEGGAGGGFYNRAGDAVLERVRVFDNRAVFSGGGVYVYDGFVELLEADVRGNLASDAGTTIDSTSYGGGMAISGTGSAVLRGGTITENVSADMGGGIGNGTNNAPDRPVTLDGVEISGNRAEGYGGGAINYHSGEPGNLVEAGGTLLSGNSAGVDGDDRYDRLVGGP